MNQAVTTNWQQDYLWCIDSIVKFFLSLLLEIYYGICTHKMAKRIPPLLLRNSNYGKKGGGGSNFRQLFWLGVQIGHCSLNPDNQFTHMRVSNSLAQSNASLLQQADINQICLKIFLKFILKKNLNLITNVLHHKEG